MNQAVQIPSRELISGWLSDFGAALERGAIADAVKMFETKCFWRDLVSFTWNIKTLEGPDEIAAMLKAKLSDVKPRDWQLLGEATAANGLIEGRFSFETAAGRGDGYVRLRDGKCWTLLTSLTELKGFEEKTGPTREIGVEHKVVKGRKTWLEQKADDEASLGYSRQPYCVIVGGGHAGIGLAARLKRLGVPAIVVDKNGRPGDSWRNRYNSLYLHDPVWFDHMPYLPFPAHWPVFSSKDKMADWLEMYAKVMELNYWHSTGCKSAQYDADRQEWEVTVERAGEILKLRPRQLILATGNAGKPYVPEIPGAQTFKGIQHHSSRHRDSSAFAGKPCIVVGANNSAHDIACELWEHGADVTMIQRSPTLVIRSESLMGLPFLARLYSESAVAAGMTTGLADQIAASVPHKIMPHLHRPIFEEIARQDASFYEGLAKAGFLFDFGGDGSGLLVMNARRASGYYIDVGASELVIDGRIKLKAGAEIARINDNSVALSDGTELPAALIVYATGYESFSTAVAALISQDVADNLGPCWGLGSGTAKDPGPWEGELRNMWKPTRQEGLWIHGGNLSQSRYYSQFLALQLKARMEGVATHVQGMPDPRQSG